MNGQITVSEEELNAIAASLRDASNEYNSSYTKLTNLIQEITRGDITGQVADDLKNKFDSKEETFKNLKATIDQAEQYMNQQLKSFNDVAEGVMAEMR